MEERETFTCIFDVLIRYYSLHNAFLTMFTQPLSHVHANTQVYGVHSLRAQF